ncbi:MAG TPA: DNA-binding protein [Verrucomicrobiae bacterium]|jgi:predicted nucleic acid-binding protein
MTVFLDANILFSAALPGSRMSLLLGVLFDHAKCVTNAYAIEEARRNLELKAPNALFQLEQLLTKCGRVGGLGFTTEKVKLKPKDLPILGGAIDGQATHLLTGDERDFGELFGKTIEGVKIVSPRMLAEEMVKLGWLEKE